MYFRTDRTELDLLNNTVGAFLSHGELSRIEYNMAQIATAYGVSYTPKQWALPSGSAVVLSGEKRFYKSDSDRIIKGLTDVLTLVRSRRELPLLIEPPTTFDRATIYTMNNLERLMQELDNVRDEYYTDVWVGTEQDDAYGKMYLPYNIAPLNNVNDEDIRNDTEGRTRIWTAAHSPYTSDTYDGALIDIKSVYSVPFYLIWDNNSPHIVWGDDEQIENLIGDIEDYTYTKCQKIQVMGTETLTIDDTVNNYIGVYTRYRLYFNLQ